MVGSEPLSVVSTPCPHSPFFLPTVLRVFQTRSPSGSMPNSGKAASSKLMATGWPPDGVDVSRSGRGSLNPKRSPETKEPWYGWVVSVNKRLGLQDVALPKLG